MKNLLSISLISMSMLSATLFAGVATDPDDYAAFYAPEYVIPSNNNLTQMEKDGRDIYNRTYKFLGLGSGVVNENGEPYVGNKMSCSNCHVADGTKPNASPMIVVAKKYSEPYLKYSSRTNEFRDIKDRVNGCMQRSMFGNPLPRDSVQMNSIVAYFEHLASGIQPGYTWKDVRGQGYENVAIPDREANINAGRELFDDYCKKCHGDDGEGDFDEDDQVFRYPALWGPDSQAVAAGFSRTETATKGIYSMMPLDKTDTTSGNHFLTVDEAYDIAGFLATKPRNWKDACYGDYMHSADETPDGIPNWMRRKADSGGITLPGSSTSTRQWVMPRRCVDVINGDYACNDTTKPSWFPLEQHRYGPFAPIKAKLAEVKAAFIAGEINEDGSFR